MAQNIADDQSIIDAARRVMQTRPRIECQGTFANLVLEELKREDESIRASPARIRKVAVSSGAVKVEIEYRETDRVDLPEICPVCGNGMSPVYNGTLDGKIVEIKRNCTVCSFSVGKKVLTPGKYIFVRGSNRDIDLVEMRIRKLRKAASFLKKASKMIEESLEGTNFPQRCDYAQEMIEEILHSREMTGSIPNLEADIRGECHSDPLWTKPLSSPKYPDRKGI